VDTLAGTALAVAAATMFGLGTVLQAEVAAAAPAADALRVRLLVRLARSPRWLVGAFVTLVGWGLQVAALLLAPVTVVQPALAFTVVAVLVLAWAMTDERLGRRETTAACAIAAGIGLVAALSPARTAGHAAAGPLAAVIAVLVIAGAAPLVRRRSVWVARLLPMAAGAAFALSAITTKLLTDAGTGAPAVATAWLVATAFASAVGGIDELSALRTAGPATVAPLVLATETLIPVALAPALFGETWPASAGHRLGLALAIAAVAGGAVVLGRSRGVASVVEEAHAPGASSSEQAASANQRS
jgi:drug/metabolite transporter (DMT)-like permease